MYTAIIVTFILGYTVIACEHKLHINKAATALFIGVLCWTLYALGASELMPLEIFQSQHHGGGGGESLKEQYLHVLVESQFPHIISEIAYILFFLVGAMTIVELVDAHEGFAVITERITAQSQSMLLVMVSVTAFFMSSVLDNLTTTIVMISVLRKLVHEIKLRHLFVGMIVIAANAGGAWSVIGDVTTTMLWIKGKIGTMDVMQSLFLPSAVCLLVPLVWICFQLRGQRIEKKPTHVHIQKDIQPWHQYLFLTTGVLALLSVPVFKTYTHLPPFMGMLLAMSILWIVSELVGHTLNEHTRSSTGVQAVLTRIDLPSVLFFLGILLAVGALASIGALKQLSVWLDSVTSGSHGTITLLTGLLSAIVDNVPLVAAGIEMYTFEMNHEFWMLLAYCAGTGGSCLIIGSAAGVAAMGLERITFVWYLRKIAPLAFMGYLAGFGTYWLQAYVMQTFISGG